MKFLKYLGGALLLFILILSVFLRVRYGGGQAYPSLATTPVLPASALEEVFAFDEPLGNIAVSKDNRIFFTVHPESRPEVNKVMEIVNGQAIPYPDSQHQQAHFNTVLGLFIDNQNRLWTIDHGTHGFQDVRLLAFDLFTNQVVHDYIFPSEVAEKGSFFNDLQVSPDGNTVYIADVSFFRKNPAVVVYDIPSGTSRRLLEQHESVYPQDWIIHNQVRTMTYFGGLIALKPGIDGIVIDQTGEYLYYGAMTHDGLYKVAAADLHNTALSPNELAEKVILVGKKPLSDGLSIDTLNNIYITDVEHGGLARMSPDGQLKTLVQDMDRVRWSDGLSYGGDGYLYFTDSAIPDQMLQSKSHMKSKAPYYIYRIDPGIGGIPGH